VRYFVLLALFGGARPVHAQRMLDSMPTTGARVRLESSAVVGLRVTGQLREVNSGYVAVSVIPQGSDVVVPWSRISSISVGTGRDAAEGATKGALMGFGASLVVYPVLTKPRARPMMQSVPRPRLVPSLVSFVVLPASGAFIGRLNGPQRWRPVIWRPTQDTVMAEGEETRLLLTSGRKIMARSQGRWIKGRVLDATDDSLALHASSTRLALPWSAVTHLNMQSGRSRARGAALGLTLMGAYTLAALFTDRQGEKNEPYIIARNLSIGVGAGALIGREAWSRIPLPAR